MSDTLRAASAACRRSAFDDFLYAPIWEDASGTPLSVLSALARLDLDPWKEAATLAQLPRERAIQKLISLIEALPRGPSTDPDPEAVVPRLIALLPRQTVAAIPSYKTLRGMMSTNHQVIQRGILYLVFLVMMLLGQRFFADHPAAARVDKAVTVASSTAPAPSPPPILGR
jgi:hypothetical protein